MRKRVSDKELENEVLELIKKLGRVPTVIEYDNIYKHRGMIVGRFGTWNNFLKSINIEPVQRHYTNEECCVEGCSSKAKRKGMCLKHYDQYLKHNKTFERTKYTRNEINIKIDYAEITAYNKEGGIKNKILIDKENVEKIKDYKVYIDDRDYAIVSIRYNEKIHLSEFLFGKLQKDKVYSYKNLNKLDCRKENIKVTNREELNRIRKKDNRNKTGYKGVFFDKKSGKYFANIGHKRHRYHLGSFDTVEEALEARKAGEKQYWGRIYTND